MKLKYYLKGLGAGILFATIVLSISFAVYNREAEKKSQDDIIAAALAAGMVWPEKETPTESTPTESTPTESTPTESTPSSDETTTESTTPEESTPEPTAPEETTPEPTVPEESTPEELTTESTTPKETTTPWTVEECIIDKDSNNVRIEIRRGMTSYDAAKILEAAGVLDGYSDRVKFNEYVIAKGYSGYVMAGVFDIPKGASYDEIIEIVCHTQ